MKQKILSYLGLAQRSGNLVSGENTCEQHIKKKNIKLIIVTSDSSENTKNKFIEIANKKHIIIHIYGTKEELSRAIGKVNRCVFGILDDNFANVINLELERLNHSSN